MSLTTPALARADLNSLLSTLTVPVVDYEPFQQPQATFVSVFFDGYDANFWNFTVRAYTPILQGARDAQVALDALLPSIEDALDSQWGPVSWTIQYDPELEALVASWPVRAGREDF